MAEIPVFKERRMTGISALGLEESYFISSSYAGILRLSPNSSSTLLDLNNDITITDEIAEYFHYEDDVTTALNNQFVTVSTSDGVLLDMSIRNDAIQFNNLYVLGALKTPNLVVYQNENNTFNIGGINMPNKHLDKGDYTNNTPSEYYIDNGVVTGEALSDKLDDYYFLINTSEDDEPTKFEFENVRTLIKKFTNEALAELNSLPAGSIHWVPVNIEEYEALLKKSDANKHNSDDLNANTLIRDFLLCDGSRYKSKDFPELAKILNGERVVYWNFESQELGSGAMMPFAETNENKENTFRVPDLRSMFIKYIVPDKIDISNDDDYFINEGRGKKKEDGSWDLGISNRVGSWEMDSAKNQEIIIDNQLDKHYHFIVLDNNTAKQSNTKSFDESSKFTFTTAISGVDEWKWDKYVSGAKPLAKYGSTRRHDNYDGNRGSGTGYNGKNLNTTHGCDTRNCTPLDCGSDNGPVSYIYPPSYGDGGSYCHGAGFTCGYVLSIGTSNAYKKTGTINLSNFVGQTSWSLSREVPYDNVNWNNYNSNSKSIYQQKETYIKPEKDRYQKENSPEFYACLPLIKI